MLNSLKLEEIKPILINLTGVRLLVLFSLLLESPKSAEEINLYFERNNYPKEIFSADTLRNDLNALRYAGCDITRADKSNDYKYTLISHPFELCIDMDIAVNIHKLYDKSYKYLPIEYLIKLENLFNILADYTIDKDVSEYLRGISLIQNINKTLLTTLIKAVRRKSTISFTYRAPNIGKTDFEFSLEKFTFRSKKLYIDGFNKTYNKSGYLLVSRIISPISENIQKDFISKPLLKVIYELKNSAKLNFNETEHEKLIETNKEKIIVEYSSDSNFKIIQQVLSYGPNCTVIYPENIKQSVINELKRMYEVYND